MLASLFTRLTGRGAGAGSDAGARLFAHANELARNPCLYREGGVPDTLDGRFAALASAVALLIVRLEACGAEGIKASVLLTERFVDVMDAEHRELGLGDPTVGKTVRKLVSLLGNKVETWRDALAGKIEWAEAAAENLYSKRPDADASASAAKAFADWRSDLEGRSIADLTGGPA